MMIFSQVIISPMNSEIIIGTLNAAGLKSYERLLYVVNRLNYMNIDIICLQETTKINKNTKKLQNNKNQKINYIWNSYTAIGYNAKLFNMIDCISSLDGRMLYCKLLHKSGEIFNIYSIYMPSSPDEWKKYYENLYEFIKIDENTIVMGDFNCYYNGLIDHSPPIETTPKNGGILKEIISNLNLIDLCRYHHKNKSLYTRIDKGKKVTTRIDHIYCTNDIIQLSSPSSIENWTKSDHMLLSFKIKNNNNLNTKFKREWIFDKYVLNKDITRIIQLELNELLLSENTCKDWINFKSKIKSYLEYEGNQRKTKTKKLFYFYKNKLNNIINNPPMKQNNIDEWFNHKSKIESKLNNIECELIDKARIYSKSRFIECYEKTTKYFYKQIKIKNNQKTLNSLYDKNNIIRTTSDQIMNISHKYYQDLYKMETSSIDDQEYLLENHKKYLNDNNNLVDKHLNSMLIGDISDEEIKIAIKSYIKESSPGPDGFTYTFYKIFQNYCIPILKKLFNSFINGIYIPKLMKSTKIILLYKKNDPNNLDNWRPISLTNCDLKIFTKILSMRLNTVS